MNLSVRVSRARGLTATVQPAVLATPLHQWPRTLKSQARIWSIEWKPLVAKSFLKKT